MPDTTPECPTEKAGHGRTTPLLALSGIQVSYGGAQALKDVDLHVGAGQIVALLGNNGAGKTSLLHAAVGIVKSRGSVTFDGTEISRLPTRKRVRLGMALVPEGRHVVADQTVAENLYLGWWLRRRVSGLDYSSAVESALAVFPELKATLDRYSGLLSGGQQEMLAIARAMMSAPRVLLLDEPGQGLAPILVERVMGALTDLARRGVGVLLAEQIAHAALGVADYAYVLGIGEVIASGPSATVRADRSIDRAFFAGQE
jgi:branched-chain amino acid transport system ATP-binding protein